MHDSELVPPPPESLPRPTEAWAPLPPPPEPDWLLARARRRRRPTRLWVHLVLLLLTILTTSAWGLAHYLSFVGGFAGRVPPVNVTAVLGAFWYSGTVLAILGCHEMGHYLACRFYGIDATLPFFLPAPIVITGTFGAVIRIRDMFPDRRSLFDVGIAGPIAGFVIAVPALFLGLWLSHVEAVPAGFTGYSLGEPLLFKAAAWAVWGNVADGFSINLHPVGFAAWLGLIVTSLNLIPIGQLDGGHISYAVLGRRKSLWVTATGITAGVLVAAYYRSVTLGVFVVLTIAMLVIGGLRHPATLDDGVALGQSRMALAILAIVMLILCFTPVPIEELLPH